MATSYLPGVVRAKHVSSYLLEISFDDGTCKVVDISQWFKGPVFELLKSVAYFRKFFVEGATVAWPNGVDISPEALYAAKDVQSTLHQRTSVALAVRRRTRAA